MAVLHGPGSSADDWSLRLPAVAADYRVILIDLPGHGRSALPAARLTVDGMARDVEALLGHVGEGPAHVVSHRAPASRSHWRGVFPAVFVASPWSTPLPGGVRGTRAPRCGWWRARSSSARRP
jgi:pimeloyl-ACP methyl ester carboxylesterase